MTQPEIIEAPEDDFEAQEDAAFARVYSRLSEHNGLGIGLAGAHRTGKSWCAESFAKSNDWLPYVKTSTREIAAMAGFDVNAANSFDDRLKFQEMVLIHHAEVFSKQDGTFITDRTPLDFAAYLLADVPNGEIDPLLDFRINKYLERCAEVANKYFVTFMVVQPGIPYVPAPGVPLPNKAYQEKINALVIGFAKARLKRNYYVIDRALTEKQPRLDHMVRIVGQEIQNYKAMLNWLPKN